MSLFEQIEITFLNTSDFKIAISDLDGTLLDDNQRIPCGTIETIRNFKSKGGLFTIASGRNEASVKPFVEELGIDVPYIVLNGAKIVSGEKVIFEEKLPRELAHEAIKHLRKFDCSIFLHIGKQTYIEEYNNDIDIHLKKDGTDAVKVDDLTRVLSEDPYKILIISEDRKVRDFLLHFMCKYETPPNIVQSESTYLEILPAGVTKGTALRKLTSYMEIPLSKVIAFGDNLNDLEMLHTAGFGVAMRNSNPELIKRADFVTGSNEEEGVAQVLEMIISTNPGTYGE